MLVSNNGDHQFPKTGSLVFFVSLPCSQEINPFLTQIRPNIKLKSKFTKFTKEFTKHFTCVASGCTATWVGWASLDSA